MTCINRSLEDIDSLLEFAKLSTSTLKNTSQTLEFPNDYNPHENILMEIPEKLIKLLNKGDRLILRGDPEDSAVLCTDNETYEVREAETSNSLMLVPELALPDGMVAGGSRVLLHRQIAGIHYKYLEVKECLPRLHKLRTLMLEAPYCGPEVEGEEDEALRQYSFNDLLERVQCSDEQLRDALEVLPAMHLGGKWRVLEFDYQFKVVSSILALLEEQLWPIDAVPRGEVLQRLAATAPRPALLLCLNYYFKQADGSDLCRVDDDHLSRLFAEVLLRPAGKFNLAEFLAIWQQSVPPGVNTGLSQLEGMALVDRSRSPAVVWHYPAEALPEDTGLRFGHLFQTRDRWTLADIRPYVQDLSSSKCPVTALLAKHTRATTQNGIKYYIAKHSK